MSQLNPLTAAAGTLDVMLRWRKLEAQDRVRGADVFRGELLRNGQDISEKTNRVLTLFSPWQIETVISDRSPFDSPSLHQRFSGWVRSRLGRARRENGYRGGEARIARLSVRLMSDWDALGRAAEEAHRCIRQVRESADAMLPPLGPTSRSALESVLSLEERLLVHAISAKELGEGGQSPRSGEALVEAYMLARLASWIRGDHENLRDLLTEDARELPGAQPARRLKRLRRKHRLDESGRLDLTVRMLRQEADMIEGVLDG